MADRMTHLDEMLGSRLLRSVSLARYTTARIGGPAEALFIADTRQALVHSLQVVWSTGIPYHLIGEGSNLLISDSGFQGLIIVNKSCEINYLLDGEVPQVTADSGINLVTLSRILAEKGLGGFEWAGGIPGSLGGAVYGNAGAHGFDMASTLESASILHRTGETETWPSSRFDYGYRTSVLKRSAQPVVVLQATLHLEKKPEDEIRALMATFNNRRKATQPPGASLGSIFKNPVGDHAGRLIEASGLKGFTIGGAAVSEKHANFLVNARGASAEDYYLLICHVQAEVLRRFGVTLETEIELIGNFSQEKHHGKEN